MNEDVNYRHHSFKFKKDPLYSKLACCEQSVLKAPTPADTLINLQTFIEMIDQTIMSGELVQSPCHE